MKFRKLPVEIEATQWEALQETVKVDHQEVLLMKASSLREANAFFKFKRAGFFKRLRWLFFGSSYEVHPQEDKE